MRILLPLLVALGPSASAVQHTPAHAPYEFREGLVLEVTVGSTIESVLTDDMVVLEGGAGSTRALVALQSGASTWDYMRAIQLLEQDARTSYVEPNRSISAPEISACGSATPSSQSCTIAFFDGEPEPLRYSDQPALAAIDVEPVWDWLGESSVLVAVIDTGIDPTHEVLVGRVPDMGWDFVADLPGAFDLANGLDDDQDGLVDEAWGHGTHIGGTITLINPNAQLLPLRVLDSDGNGTAWNVARAIEHATLAGAKFINLSLGMHHRSQVVANALRFAHENDVQVLASAGNTGARRVLFPGRHDKTIAIAATDYEDLIAPFSAYGERVDLCAPGVDIYGPMPSGQYAWWSGCSMATAVATGAASLVWALDPLEEAEEAADAVEDNAVDIDPNNPSVGGWLGDGRIDALQAALDILED